MTRCQLIWKQTILFSIFFLSSSCGPAFSSLGGRGRRPLHTSVSFYLQNTTAPHRQHPPHPNHHGYGSNSSTAIGHHLHHQKPPNNRDQVRKNKITSKDQHRVPNTWSAFLPCKYCHFIILNGFLTALASHCQFPPMDLMKAPYRTEIWNVQVLDWKNKKASVLDWKNDDPYHIRGE